MSYISDNFISYDNEFTVKQEKLSVHDDSVEDFPTSESTPPYSISVTQTLQNLLAVNEQTLTLDPFPCSASTIASKKQPFKIIKDNAGLEIRKSSFESFEVKVECEEKLVNRSKRIMKREKAKQRLKVKQEAVSPILSSVNSKYIPEGFDNPDLDEKTRRKMVQMIRNRISAQSSRDRKKAYMMQLEDAKALLCEENTKLAEEKEDLVRQLKKLERTQKKLRSENEELKKNMEKKCEKCGQSKCGQGNKDAFGQCSTESFSKMLSSLTGSDFGKLQEGNQKYKRMMTFTTMISVMMVMNIIQQGNQMMQGEADFFKASGISAYDKRMLQEAVMAGNFEGNEEKILSEWGLLEFLPLIRKFEECYYKGMEQETTGANSSPETSASQIASIKLEDFDSRNQVKDIEHIGTVLSKRRGIFDDDFESHEDGKPNSIFFGNNEKMHIEDEQDYDLKSFGIENADFLKDFSFGKLFSNENNNNNNNKENNLFDSWSRILANNCFGFNQ